MKDNNNKLFTELGKISSAIDNYACLEEKFLSHINEHKLIESTLKETEDRVEKYVVQQLNNSRVLQAYIEREIFLSKLSNEICLNQLKALEETSWWNKITKKSRSNIMERAKLETQAKHSKTLEALNEHLTNVTKVSNNAKI